MNENEVLNEKKIVKIDGKEVSEEELREKQASKNTRLFQETPTTFRTLTRLTE